ncbi:MAG: FAD-dependent oxidoreductase [Gammaproteobacteria bacterium]|jgi:3-phenylpropionate/trans-cinnamate dioxygenase ferredoxin reductase subunit|nr:FAD-dependent oxidoreductase [Gammaproteobacteria bacterium]MDH3803863.1 FAD-dependent oxidoreductase [Gammaproteobacteria bacterium]
MTTTVVIVGAGHAAGQAIATLKQNEFAGRIVLVGDESYLPYQRPPLSKKFLAGEMPAERLYLKPASFYADDRIDVCLDTRVDSIDREAHTIRTAERTELVYDKLILAVGSRVRKVPVPGSELAGVHYLRSIADVERIRAGMSKGKRLVIIGAGYIGLEVAAVCRQLGLDVTVIEMTDRVMSRVVSPNVSDFYQLEHTNRGVELLLSTELTAFQGKKRVKSVATDNAQTIPADLVVVGIGILPNTELAEAAGLRVDDGIVVNDQCQTADPDVYAIGDCTSHPNSIYGRRLRLESVHNALEQAKTAASNICGIETHYSDVPWFWSDQYDLKLQIAGLSQGYDAVVLRGDPAGRSFACLYLKGGSLIAVDAVNAPRDFMQSKALIADHAVCDMEQLADVGIALKDLE